CAQGTRVQILADIEKWANNSDTILGYWICGMAGTGKSTITKSMCLILEDKDLLAGSFFCSQQIPECRDYQFMIPTLAYHLGHYSKEFNMHLRRVLTEDPDVVTKSPEVQIAKLFVKPWLECVQGEELQSCKPILVLHALDEC
ncbi:hypothetical protein GYMLUDRAFT_114124, partial [Collybiopsis luxurians FD-317 M1]